MDIAYMRDSDGANNGTNRISSNFIEKNPKISIPYLALISAFTLNGCVGNVMVIGAVLVYKPLKKVGNIFVVNLALADLSITGFVNPFSIVGIIKGEVWFQQRPVLCSVIGSMCLESCFCSLLSIMVISIDRYVHICKNQRYIDIFTKRKAILICVGVWIFSFVLQIPTYFGFNEYKYDQKNLGCLWDRTHPSPYLFITFGTVVALPTVTILCCYYKIFTYAKMCQAMVATISNNASTEKQNSLQLVKTSCTIFTVFAICWTPHTILAIADRNDVIALPIHLYGILFAHMNSSINCIIYGLTNKQFRIGYRKLLGLDKKQAALSLSINYSNTSLSCIDANISRA